MNGLSPRARIGTGYTLIVPSESEGERISLSSLMPNRPQAGAVEPPPPPPPRALIQRTVVRGKGGRLQLIERKLPVSAAPAPAARGKATEKAPAKAQTKAAPKAPPSPPKKHR